MSRIVELLPVSTTLRLIVLLVVIVSLQGCAATKIVHEEYQPLSRGLEEYGAQNEFSVAKGDDVIGRLAFIRLEKGDTLPDLARHFGLGIKGITAANPGVNVWVPKAGERIMLPLSFVLPDAPRKGIVINLATMRLFHYRDEGDVLTVLTYPVGVGTEERPSPTGQMMVVRKTIRPTWHVPASIAEDHRKKGDLLPAKVLPGPQNPLGEYALYLSRPSYLIHGTNKPASIGLKATNGCIRLYPENVKKLFENTPVKTPVLIVNQPYLIGKNNGTVYLEVHASPEDLAPADFDTLYAKLRKIEKELGRTLDWSSVRNVLAEARGIPAPILEISPGKEKQVAEAVEVRHPGELFGRPEIPELKADAWSVLAADLHDEIDAVRMAAIISHQGPPIPARVVSKNGSYQVVAGPFNDISEARDAIKRLKIDLEIDARLMERTVARTPSAAATKEEQKMKKVVPAAVERPHGVPENPGGYALQIGVFAEEKNALSLIEKLKQQGYGAEIRKDGNGPLHRVLLGRFDTIKKALEESRLILKKDGIESVIHRY